MAVIDVYGLKNCDTCKKALAWLDAQGVDHAFHDVKKAPLPADLVKQWLSEIGWATLINKRGTTWRQLSDADKAKAESTKGACDLIVANPSLMKRPVFDLGHERLVGVGPEQREALSEL